MAKIFPSIEQISPIPTPWELYLLKCLEIGLDDSFEIFFNPFFNGDRPDVVVEKKGVWVFFIEVKDWNLSNYRIDNRNVWRVLKNDSKIISPIEQSRKYKDNLFSLHIKWLFEEKVRNQNVYWISRCFVYFHKETKESLNDFFKISKAPLKWGSVEYVRIFWEDEIGSIISSFLKIPKNPLYTNRIHSEICRYLKPPFHYSYEGEEIEYNDKQKSLIHSVPGEFRIEWVVWSWKTTVLAARAANAHERTGGKVLILTYNITLRNYLHDKISKVRQDFPWDAFQIDNYHNFINSALHNLGIPIIVPKFTGQDARKKEEIFFAEFYSDPNMFDWRQSEFMKYDAIFIDEMQDYPFAWMEIIKRNFLKEWGEYVLFWDEKQNIYGNVVENKKMKTNVKGRPGRLTVCMRSDERIVKLAKAYQRNLMASKYEVDDFESKQTNISFLDQKNDILQYAYITQKEDASIVQIHKIVNQIIHELWEHSDDVAVLGTRISTVRELESVHRAVTWERTNIMCETMEAFISLFLGIHKVWSDAEDRIKLARLVVLKRLDVEYGLGDYQGKLLEFWKKDSEISKLYELYISSVQKGDRLPWIGNKNVTDLRKSKKANFWLHSWTVKFSTIESFKWWEIKTLFLVVDDSFDEEESSYDELIYTGITRSKQNLIIINRGNVKLHGKMQSIFSGW